MLKLVILVEFSEIKLFLRNLVKLGDFLAKIWSPGGVQKWSKSGPSRDPAESGYGQKHKDFLMFSKSQRVMA